jgi:hypothetical protein
LTVSCCPNVALSFILTIPEPTALSSRSEFEATVVVPPNASPAVCVPAPVIPLLAVPKFPPAAQAAATN